MLACFLVSTGDPFLHCEEWLARTEALPVGNMSSQRVSELLAAISPEEREIFYVAWSARRREREYLALDITSISSYSELIEDIEWGYNRDHENLPQVNICMLMGEDSRLPIYQTVYSGSLKDVSTLKTTLAKLDIVTGERPVLMVIDKGFFSKKNVDLMLIDEKIKKFIISVPFTSTFAKNQVENERKNIDTAKNTIVVGEDSMRAVTRIRFWDNEHKVFTHIFYGAEKATRKKEEIYAHIAVLREEAEASPEKYLKSNEHMKWLVIRKSSKMETGYSVSIRDDAVEKALAIAGWVVIISNDVEDAKKAMRIYRAKDVIEKGFLRLKRSLDLGRLRVHSQESMQNKVFIGFIALIMLSEIHTIMSDKGIYRKMGMKQLIRALGKHRVQEIGGTRIVFPETKEQRQIYEAFGVDVPV
jgi:transposase